MTSEQYDKLTSIMLAQLSILAVMAVSASTDGTVVEMIAKSIDEILEKYGLREDVQ